MYIVVILNMSIVWCCVWFIVIAHSIFHNMICCAALNPTCVPLPHVFPPLSHHGHMAIKRANIFKNPVLFPKYLLSFYFTTPPNV